MNEETVTKRPRKLSKAIVDSRVEIEVLGADAGKTAYDFDELPEHIQAKLGPFGLGHKLGDAAAGKEGQEAQDAINKVWEGLLAGDMTTRVPAEPKVKVSEIKGAMGSLSGEEAEAAKQLMAKLGIEL